MERFFRAILSHRKLVTTLFVVAALLCALCIPQVEVNGDFSDYLPEDSESTVAIEVMDEAFDGDVANLRVYVEDITLAQASALDESYGALESIIDCSWLGDNVDVYEPLEVADEDTVSSWKDDGGYLFELTLEAPYEQNTVDELRAMAEGIEGAGTVAIDGNAASTASVVESVGGDIAKVMVIAIAAVLIIMGLATTSFLYPLLALIAIGIAVVINLGTNIVQGEVSTVTQLVAAVLQLAVSMDYSIVLLSAYQGVREEERDPFEAMVKTCVQAFPVVISSAAVTFFGFVSLVFMRFLIGVDMGLVLAKGIVCSFLSIMLLMPCLVYMCRKPCERLAHRPLFSQAGGFANVCRALAIPAALIVALIVVPCYVAQDMTDFEYGSSSLVNPDSQLGQDGDYIAEKFGEEQMWAVLVPEGDWESENALVEELEALETTTNVTSYVTAAGSAMPTEVVGESTLSQLISGGYSRIIMTSDVADEGDETFALVEDVRSICESYYGDEYHLVGNSVSTYDIKVVATADSIRVRLASMLAIGIVLLLMFRSLSLPIILVFTIEVSIWINMAIPYFIGSSISYIGYLVIDAVQLGAAVDYSIIYTHEYLKQRRTMPARKAARLAISNATLPILTSSTILMVSALGINFVASSPMVQTLGMLIFRGALLADVLIFLVLPSLFIVLDWVIRHTSIGLGFYTPGAGGEQDAQPQSEAHGALPAASGADTRPDSGHDDEAAQGTGISEDESAHTTHADDERKDETDAN